MKKEYQPIKIVTEPINSSNIKAAGYDQPTRTLQLEFWNGAIYQYTPITLTSYHSLIRAKSVGKYFNEHISSNELVSYYKILGIKKTK